MEVFVKIIEIFLLGLIGGAVPGPILAAVFTKILQGGFKKSWKIIANILSGLKEEEPESIRRMVLGYCQAILLKGVANNQVGVVMEVFMEPFYNSGFPQLTLACYVSINGN